jgi:putative NADH-flavin reductase
MIFLIHHAQFPILTLAYSLCSIGATGHIGNAVLNAIYIRFPDLEIVALVRDDEKASQVSKRYKNVTTIVGDFRDLASIESESKSSAIIISMSHASTSLYCT